MQTEIQGDNQAMVTQVLSNEYKKYGCRIGYSGKDYPNLTASGLASIGQYTYTNNPKLYFASDAMGVSMIITNKVNL